MSRVEAPVLTVGITCYNDERYLRQCIDSVLGQTVRGIEVLVVDDCSTDRSPAILAEYGDRLRVLRHETNSGSLTLGRREVIAAARGEFVAHLDADDFLEPEFAERQLAEFRRDPALDWVAPGLNVIDAEGTLLERWVYRSFSTDVWEALYRGYQTGSVAVPTNGLFKLRFLRDNGLGWYELPNTRQGEDALTCVRYLECSPRICIVPDCLLNYRKHGGNLSHSARERVEMVIGLREYYIEHFNALVYLRHPALLRFPVHSQEYRALKYLLIAESYRTMRQQFRLPAMLAGADGRVPEECLARFDERVRCYAEKSAALSSRFRDDAARLLEAACRSGPAVDRAQELHRMAKHAFARGQGQEAWRAVSAALELQPRDAELLNDAAVIAGADGRLEASERLLLRALEADPGSEQTHRNLCRVAGALTPRSPLAPARKALLLRSLRWLAEHAPDPSREALLAESRALRRRALEQHKDVYRDRALRLLLHRPANGALRYLMESWRDVLNHLGVSAELLEWDEDLRERLEQVAPHAFITVADPVYQSRLERGVLSDWRRRHGMQVGQITTFAQRFEPCDFSICFHLDPRREPAARGRRDEPLLSLPFGINPLVHHMRPAAEVWDYFFVGTHSPHKADATARYLEPILRHRGGVLAGVGWPYGIGELAVSEAVEFYQAARVCPNFHVERQRREYNEVNERTYVIPACGAFQILDRPAALRSLFTEEELVSAATPEEFHALVAHFLEHPQEREPFVRQGMRRVWREYTLFTRLAPLVGQLAGDDRIARPA